MLNSSAFVSSWDCITFIGSKRLFIHNEPKDEEHTCFYAVLQAFSGTQNVSNQQKEEAWRVNVQIQGIDLEHGYLCGTMEALNVPMADTPVITFWEGEIVDGKNYTFYTGKWEATREDDMRHWSKFPSFSPLQGQVESDGGRQLDLNNYPYIFMV
jgi:hypothetical protein